MAPTSPHENYISNEDDPENMPARITGSNPSSNASSPKQAAAQRDSEHAPASTDYKQSPERLFTDMVQQVTKRDVLKDLGDTVLSSKQVLADFHRASSAGESTIHGDDPPPMLAKLDRDTPTTPRDDETGEIEPPPAEPEIRPVFIPGTQTPLVKLPKPSPVVPLPLSVADLQQNASSLIQKPAEDDEESIDALYSRLTNTPAPVCTQNDKDLDGPEAQREKQKVIRQAELELAVIIEQTLQEEKRHSAAEEEARLPRRLVVSRIAADAIDEDLKEFFYQFRFDLYVRLIPLQLHVLTFSVGKRSGFYPIEILSSEPKSLTLTCSHGKLLFARRS
jgi:hypothetical protein